MDNSMVIILDYFVPPVNEVTDDLIFRFFAQRCGIFRFSHDVFPKMLSMKAHFFQHVPFENLGSMEPWLRSQNYAISHTPFFDAENAQTLPALGDVDFLIILGGPMGVNDEAEFPWLVREKEFIRQAIAAEKPMLGICLGAQLIANTLGAKVYPNKVKEIGWFPIKGRKDNANPDLFQFPPSTEVFHWHGETFDLPPGAQLIASSQVCQNQAFQIGRSIIGLQCHLETTPAGAQALVQNCGDELVPGPFVQNAAAILADNPERFATIEALMAQLLDYLCCQGGQ